MKLTLISVQAHHAPTMDPASILVMTSSACASQGMQEISVKGLEMSAMTNLAKMGDYAQSVGLKLKTTPVNAGQGS